jgi:hypothetical protein
MKSVLANGTISGRPWPSPVPTLNGVELALIYRLLHPQARRPRRSVVMQSITTKIASRLASQAMATRPGAGCWSACATEEPDLAGPRPAGTQVDGHHGQGPDEHGGQQHHQLGDPGPVRRGSGRERPRGGNTGTGHRNHLSVHRCWAGRIGRVRTLRRKVALGGAVR